ncbi:hypothetical protein BCV73_12880 [Paenibacillus sp. SSG-1]|nr:hypothetical protein BCV73_12880 [Paenibacillus sp. SSG-1]
MNLVFLLSKDKNIVPWKVAILAAFFVLSEQVLVPITVMDKNLSRLPILTANCLMPFTKKHVDWVMILKV